MKSLLITMLLVLVTNILFSQNSHIQITAEPGISVFLDGKFKGETSKDFDGLIIQNLDAGSYNIKVVKKGFIPQEESISINAGEVFSYLVKPFKPKVTIEHEGNVESQSIEVITGNLIIQSLPVSISIQIPALDINSNKPKDRWIIKDVPVGKYSAIFKWNSKTLNFDIEIEQNRETHLFVNMLDSKIDHRGSKFISTIVFGTVPYGSFTDPRDDNTYKTVKIGSQTWMAQNLAFLPTIFNCKDQSDKENRYYVFNFYGNNAEEAKLTEIYPTYGVLYNWPAALEACPEGWHLPSENEWNTLEKIIGGYEAVPLKEIGNHHWVASSGPGTNSTGFTGLPGSSVANSQYWQPEFGKKGLFWSSSERSNMPAEASDYIISHSTAGPQFNPKKNGLSVRCIKN